MTADPRVESSCTPVSGLAEALYFDSGEHRLFGWLHLPPAGTTASTGLVVCKPFGYEAICSHRGVRAFADAAAALGVPSLRFDYSGTGDSADVEAQADQLDLWSRDVVTAVGELQRRTGVERVCLLGFRLGALLAALAAAQCKAVNALILIAPVLSGRRYLRELLTTRLAASLGTDPVETVRGTQGDIQAGSADSMEVSGFSLSAATVAALAQVDLTTLGAPSVSEMLVIDRNDLPVAREWVEGLSGRRVRTEYLALAGLVGMLMTEAQVAIIPQPIVAAVRKWLLRFQREPSAQCEGGERHFKGNSVPPATILPLPGDGSPSDLPANERPVFFGSTAELFGIVSEPREGETRRRAVILLNVGAEYHIGSSRMYVSLARRWARHGYTVLRLDLAGLGDSGTRPGRPDNEVFPPAALDDVRAAIEFMRGRYNVGDITLGGLCSGAYHSLRAAVALLPVNRILIVNPMNFFWKEGMTAESLQQSVDVARNLGFYRERMVSPMIWRRILTGQLGLWRLVRILLKRPLLTLESTLRNLARRLRIRLPHDLGWDLEAIGSRGVRIVFVFSRGEPGIDLLKLQGGSSVRRLGDHCRIHIIESADHIFTQSGQRAILESILTDELFARNQRITAVEG
jgi:alpha-beta hydrolase superfamily lysophospholipase